MEKTNRRGGKRPGAGRPKGSKSKMTSVKLAEFEMADMLKAFPVRHEEIELAVQRRLVAALSMLGLESEDIGLILDRSASEVEVQFVAERQVGLVTGRARMIVTLFQRAVGPDDRLGVPANLTLLKIMRAYAP